MTYRYAYPRPAVSADAVVFGQEDKRLQVLLIQRGNQPFQGQWALPGGFMDEEEDLDNVPVRELEEETGLHGIALQQLGTYGRPDRDPRTRVISVVYFGLARIEEQAVRADDDAVNADWFHARRLPRLAFDHNEIIKDAVRQLMRKVRCQPAMREWLPREFSWQELLELYQIVLDQQLDSRYLKKQLLASGVLASVTQKGMYRFDLRQYRKLERCGWSLDIR